jgi:pimeloyl-ACP methyl ester carboxylesterase
MTSNRYDIDSDTSPGLRVGAAPLLMLHGRYDDQVPPAFVLPWVQSSCERGQVIQLEWFDTGHRVPYEAAASVSPLVFDWIQGRFAGTMAASSCSDIPQP